ncbi:GNAT family N-acetyltransferase [Halapricum hydrolyticum]|uniref:GNAT family N-acetyltransferase n=1 Tax=Halapricum hydrolyticum TaxID=2979991 RepID=A0AAE3LE72_9EURY|nr:GNAT family N-acetyltransferase [Halapricum hydrolyticum]MCU4717119.1 GNAT family N-acetyltransferase [Halapricum hydrolyticum]MCU4726046.1 GNAT family N-acetyltransferase [Halapricum hydrolyticum]
MDLEIRTVDAPDEDDPIYQDALSVRTDVFVEEQDVPADLEVDEHESAATHFVAYDDGMPIGAARLREPEESTGKVERFAVQADYRERGVGTALMERLEAVARGRGIERLRLHSQVRAAPFYARFGYERVGKQFEEAGIPHVEMRKSIEPPSDF